ncbi:MAG: FhaA domain-containing protein [Gaiellaceae bacterium]
MAVLRSIERRIEAIFEGAFGRAFRAHVQPVELARKLAKEMDEHRTASVTRVYVPNEYTIYLSQQDRDQFSSYEEALCNELQEYLGEHAQRERYALPSAPLVRIETDDDLEIGEFGISTKMARTSRSVPIPEPPARPVVPQPAPIALETQAFTPDAPLEAAALPTYALLFEDASHPLRTQTIVIGRSRDCDIHVADPNVSRRHAEVRPDGSGGFTLIDLGSTNGTELNGKRVSNVRLSEGDTITVGAIELTFVRE